MKVASRGNHWAFYVVLLAMPPFGLLALVSLDPLFGQIHAALAAILVALIVLHVAGALLHWVRPGSDAHRRMLRPIPTRRRRTTRNFVSGKPFPCRTRRTRWTD